jgi:hypothetical protein
MSLIRICGAANLNKWDREPCDFAAIAKEWFAVDRDPNPSVYRAESESEEVEVAASHSLTDLGPSLKPVHLLRIEWSDLVAIGAAEKLSDRTPGTTGVVRVDFRHSELLDGRVYLDALVRRIRERYEAGEQRFRWVGPPVLRRQVAQFCALSDHEVIQEAKRRCRHKLNAGPGTLPRPGSDELRRQLRDARPKIPEWVIQDRSFRLYQGTGRHDADQNWYETESELLALYVEAFVRYTPPPTHMVRVADVG